MGYFNQPASGVADPSKVTIMIWVKVLAASLANDGPLPILLFGQPCDGYKDLPSSIVISNDLGTPGVDICIASKRITDQIDPAEPDNILRGDGVSRQVIHVDNTSRGPCGVGSCFIGPDACGVSGCFVASPAGSIAYLNSTPCADPGVGNSAVSGFFTDTWDGASWSDGCARSGVFWRWIRSKPHPDDPPSSNSPYPRDYYQAYLHRREVPGIVLDSWNQIIISVDWSREAHTITSSGSIVVDSAPRLCVMINGVDHSPTSLDIVTINPTRHFVTSGLPSGSILPRKFLQGDSTVPRSPKLGAFSWYAQEYLDNQVDPTNPDPPDPTRHLDPPGIAISGQPLSVPGDDLQPDSGWIYYPINNDQTNPDQDQANDFLNSTRVNVSPMQMAYYQIFPGVFRNTADPTTLALWSTIQDNLVKPKDDGTIAKTSLGDPAYWFIRDKNKKKDYSKNFGTAGDLTLTGTMPTDYFPGPGQSATAVAPRFSLTEMIAHGRDSRLGR